MYSIKDKKTCPSRFYSKKMKGDITLDYLLWHL